MKHLPSWTCLAAISLLATSIAHAQDSRTWVSGVGDDANPCTRTAPCKTFAGAISKTAAGGEIDALDPGGFGSVTITKAMTIDGGAGQIGSILSTSGARGVNVAAGANDVVTLRNLSLQGAGTGSNGIRMISGKVLHIEHCKIAHFTEGIYVAVGAATQVFIENTESSDNANHGLFVSSTAGTVRASVTNSHFSSNGEGIYSGDNSRAAVKNSDANNNANIGFAVEGDAGSAILSIADSTASNNGVAGVSAVGTSATSVRISHVSVFSNPSAFLTSGLGTVLSFGNNSNAGTGAPTSLIPLE